MFQNLETLLRLMDSRVLPALDNLVSFQIAVPLLLGEHLIDFKGRYDMAKTNNIICFRCNVMCKHDLR